MRQVQADGGRPPGAFRRIDRFSVPADGIFSDCVGCGAGGSRAAASAVKVRKKRDGRENGLHQAAEISARAASPADGQSGLTTRKLCRINR